MILFNMALTQESVLVLLLAQGGRVQKQDLVSHFRGLLDRGDPEEKRRNRDLFKALVNSVATVREVDGVRYVVVRRRYRHLLSDQSHIRGLGEPPEGGQEAGGGGSGPEDERRGGGAESPPEAVSPAELALRRSASMGLRFKVRVGEAREGGGGGGQGKPYALPLRTPAAPARPDALSLGPDPPPRPAAAAASPRVGRRTPGSPRPGGAAKRSGALGEPQELRATPPSSSAVPLEEAEHEWLVRCAAGQWGRVYGLLLRDRHLAPKRDFMTGFTALHWAAKCGNHDMLVKIIDRAREGGVQVDVNAKTHGGYTPLHIAALHKQEYVATILMAEYGADPNVRDNGGKRAHHYLQGGASGSVREMLGRPPAPRAPEKVQGEREEADLSRGRHSISRLFQPHTAAAAGGGQKKKARPRPGLPSLGEDAAEEQPDGGAPDAGERVAE